MPYGVKPNVAGAAAAYKGLQGQRTAALAQSGDSFEDLKITFKQLLFTYSQAKKTTESQVELSQKFNLLFQKCDSVPKLDEVLVIISGTLSSKQIKDPHGNNRRYLSAITTDDGSGKSIKKSFDLLQNKDKTRSNAFITKNEKKAFLYSLIQQLEAKYVGLNASSIPGPANGKVRTVPHVHLATPDQVHLSIKGSVESSQTPKDFTLLEGVFDDLSITAASPEQLPSEYVVPSTIKVDTTSPQATPGAYAIPSEIRQGSEKGVAQ